MESLKLNTMGALHAIKEIATGKWLQATGGDTFVDYVDSSTVIFEAGYAGCEADVNRLNAITPGRTGIFSSPRPH